ncbi:uncharacterized protein [Scyliorhinus torazame]|uniref:uncharacterized protein n=1 Tax=Scyliorhinus torazame TaxID=75743 RepID=UPI003B5B505B
MATNPEDEALPKAGPDQEEFIPSDDSLVTPTDNEENHISSIGQFAEEGFGDDEVEDTSRRISASSLTSDVFAADVEFRRKKYGPSVRSLSLISGRIMDLEDEERRLSNVAFSKRSASLASATISFEVEDHKSFDQNLKNWIMIKTEKIEAETDMEDSHDFHQVSAKSTFGKGIILHAANELDGTAHSTAKRKVSIADRVTVEHGDKVPTGKRIFDNAFEESDSESAGAPSKMKGFYVSAIHDPAMPKSRLETKRASFQTSEIGGLSVDDTKDDEDESEGEKLLWKRMFERKVAKRLLNLQEQKAILLKKRKHEKAILERKVPVDLLSKEWFNENNVTVQIRLYLLEKLLPTLILGLEKLLMEVGKNRLTVLETPHPYFNPINFLAQYLMRNNPWFRKPPEGNPYVHGLKHVVEQLNIHVVDIKDNRLSTLKAETQQRQKEREQQHKIHLDNEEKRRKDLRLQYRNWMWSTNGNVLLFLVKHKNKSSLLATNLSPDESNLYQIFYWNTLNGLM